MSYFSGNHQTEFQFKFPAPIEQHPCYWKLGRRLSHRGIIPYDDEPFFCERCCAELDRTKRAICEEA
jgi:hypothetical protein